MWQKFSGIILRNRISFLLALGVITIFMGMQIPNLRLYYQYGGLLPENDSTQVAYDQFRNLFDEDANILVLGLQDAKLYEYESFNAWYELGNDLLKIEGVDSIYSVAHLFNINKNTEKQKFEFYKMMSRPMANQHEMDSLKKGIESLPFYRDLLYNEKSNANLMMVFVDSEILNSKRRTKLVAQVKERADLFSNNHIELHYSGLPYIRTVVMARVKKELNLFIFLAILVTSLIMYLFFRSFKVVGFSILVVVIGVIWSVGFIALLDFELTLIMALIPPLVIVIGIPNCVFLLNKYHSEFLRHGNQVKSLQRVIQKIGNATFMTNATTATGFATFIFTKTEMLQRFGIIASMSIMAVFVLSILLIPIIFSYLKPPSERQTRHLNRQWLYTVVNGLVHIVKYYRRWVYVVSLLFIIVGAYGITLIKTSGNIVDDIPKNDPVLYDLQFFEKNFNGVMPFEVMIDTRKKGQALKPSNLKKIEKLQLLLTEYPQLSKSLSIADAAKFAKQAFYNGLESKYSLIKGNEKSFIAPYFDVNDDQIGVTSTFIDSERQVTRITAQVADIGTDKMDALVEELRPRIDSIFNPEKYSVNITGTSIVFTRGTSYLVGNLFTSLLIAICFIAFFMALLFRSGRMVLVSLVPNLLPLLSTAALMGYFGITIKPSTILVFSVAFGISVDDTIHYLAKYRQELKGGINFRDAVFASLRETGISMIYTSIVLFFGFLVFTASNFGGTIALGMLVSFTLLVAMLSNLVLLPTMLLTFEKSINLKAFKTDAYTDILEENIKEDNA